MAEENAPTAESEGPLFDILRIYLKDVSFESPNSPAAFIGKHKSDIEVQINTWHTPIRPHVYEVVLKLTVTSKTTEQTMFLVELEQAGVFTVKDYEGEQADSLLGAYCPNILFPFAREAVSDLVTKGGFPQLLLAPINFDALYAQKQQEQAQQTDQQATQ